MNIVNREALEAGARVTETFYSAPEAESGSSGISLTPQLRIPARDGFLGCFNNFFLLIASMGESLSESNVSRPVCWHFMVPHARAGIQ